MSDLTADAKGGIRVDLDDAGFVMLILNVNLSTLRGADRLFVLGILEKFIQRAGG